MSFDVAFLHPVTRKKDIADIVARLLLVEDNLFWLLSVIDMIQSDTKQRCQIIIK